MVMFFEDNKRIACLQQEPGCFPAPGDTECFEVLRMQELSEEHVEEVDPPERWEEVFRLCGSQESRRLNLGTIILYDVLEAILLVFHELSEYRKQVWHLKIGFRT